MSANEAATMPKFVFFYGSNETTLEPPCQKVLKCFQLPQHSLICIFDNVERDEFRLRFGEGYCGFFPRLGVFYKRKAWASACQTILPNIFETVRDAISMV